ncbi:hypothetical protein DL770_008347 [Monosporascus sp. CRB-9-2]|nr:hypothetical protein DL770_008347 [Monosporascus sp. CRB-9-2]
MDAETAVYIMCEVDLDDYVIWSLLRPPGLHGAWFTNLAVRKILDENPVAHATLEGRRQDVKGDIIWPLHPDDEVATGIDGCSEDDRYSGREEDDIPKANASR